MQKDDKLIIGGHEFSSRFILGSGKYSLDLIEAAVKDAGAEIITLAVRRANTKKKKIFLTIFRRALRFCRTPRARGTRKKQYASHALRVSSAAAIL